jgi:hypothetical protein
MPLPVSVTDKATHGHVVTSDVRDGAFSKTVNCDDRNTRGFSGSHAGRNTLRVDRIDEDCVNTLGDEVLNIVVLLFDISVGVDVNQLSACSFRCGPNAVS